MEPVIDLLAQESTNTSSVESLTQLLVLMIIILLIVLSILGVWKWLMGSDKPKADVRVKNPLLRPAGTPDKERIAQVVIEPGTVTSIRPVHPDERTGDSSKGEVVHYLKKSDAVRERPTFEGGFTELLDPDTGEQMGLYQPSFTFTARSTPTAPTM